MVTLIVLGAAAIAGKRLTAPLVVTAVALDILSAMVVNSGLTPKPSGIDTRPPPRMMPESPLATLRTPVQPARERERRKRVLAEARRRR